MQSPPSWRDPHRNQTPTGHSLQHIPIMRHRTPLAERHRRPPVPALSARFDQPAETTHLAPDDKRRLCSSA